MEAGVEDTAARTDSIPPQEGKGASRLYRLRFLPMLFRLYWLRLRTQPAQEALVVAGIAAGVALIFAVEIANTSVPASVRDLVRGIAGPASLEVAARTPEGFDERLASKVDRAPGVLGDAGILDARVTVLGPRGRRALTLFGAEPSVSLIGGTLARRFPTRALESVTPSGEQAAPGLIRRLHGAHVDTIVLPEGAAHALGASTGQLLLVDADGRQVVVLCGGILSTQQFGAAAESPVAIAQLPAAQRITGLAHRLTRILILPERGQEATARRALTGLVGRTLNVRSSDSEVSLLEAATRSSKQVATLFTALSVVVGVLFAYNAMLLSLPERRRHIARLRNQGAYRYELVSLMTLEILAVGVVASLVGLILGDLLSRTVFGSVPSYLAAGFAIGTQRVITPVAVLISVAGGVLATVIAAAGPAIGTLRGRSLESTGESAEALSLGRLSGSVGLAVGIAAITAAIMVALLIPGSGLVTVGALAVGLAFVLAPAVPWLIHRSVGAATRLRSPAGYVATVELRAAPTRATAVAATSAIAVYAIVAIGGALNDIRRGAEAATRDIVGAAPVGVLATRLEDDPFPVQQFQPGPALARLRAVKDVAWTEALQGSFLDTDSRRLLVIAKPPDDPNPVPSSQIVAGSAHRAASLFKQGHWAALSAIVASERDLHLGDSFVLPTPSGDETFRLVATITNYGWPPGAILMNSVDYARLWRTESVTAMRVGLRPGVSAAEGRRIIEESLGGTGLTVRTAQQDEASVRAVTSQGLIQLGQISTLLLVSAVLAVIAVMFGSIWQRRGRLATLKRLGMSRGELVSTIYLETGIVVLFGCAIGAAFGLAAQPLATQYIRQSTGFPESFSPAFSLGLGTLALSTILAMVATGLLGFLVTRRSIMWRASV